MAVMSASPLFAMSSLITDVGPIGLSPEMEFDGMDPQTLEAQSQFIQASAGGAISFKRLIGPGRDSLKAAGSRESDPAALVGNASDASQTNHELRFIEGRYKGTTYPLQSGRDVMIGRSRNAGISLAEAGVSEKHAQVSLTDQGVVLSDLGSQSGTFVNGKRISRALLKNGDSILIGSAILRYSVSVPSSDRPKPASGRPSPAPIERPISGSIEVLPLTDLLQVLSASGKSGRIHVDSDQESGDIYLREGRVYYSSIEGRVEATPEKSLFRMLRWTQGTFQFDGTGEIKGVDEIRESLTSLLMEAMRQLDEIRRLEGDMPMPHARLTVVHPLTGRLRDLSPQELDLFQLVLMDGTLEEVLDLYTGSDLEAYTALQSLLNKGFIAAKK